MGDGRSRNEPCWCGSGKKYKHCHLHRDQEARIQPWEADKGLRASYGAKRCMAPEALRETCSGDIVRAHTVSKSGSLKQIARDGHVYSFVKSIQAIVGSNGVLTPELVGVNKASTFTGFCATHDKQLFAPIEDSPFAFTEEQCFLLGYRAMARETFLKEAQLEGMGFLRQADRGHPVESQLAIQTMIAGMQVGSDAGARDALRQKAFYDEVLLSKDFSGVRAYAIAFDRMPPVLCSGGVFPYEAFDGTKVQDFADLGRPADAIYYASLAVNGAGAVVFSWLPDSDATCSRFIATLEQVDDAGVTDALLRFFFEFCENLHVSPEWWESLEEASRRALIGRLTAAGNVTVPREDDCLVDDGRRYDDWGVSRRFWVGLTPAST